VLIEREPLRIAFDGTSDMDAWWSAIDDTPAVFLIWPREGSPYLARTARLRRRLARLLGPRASTSRLLSLREVAARLEVWPTASWLESTLVHYALMRRHFPDNYRSLLRLRPPTFVKLVRSNAFPRTHISRHLSRGESFYYGPFRTHAAAEEFQNQFLDLFQIRRCQEDLAPSPEHPGCIYGEMGMCLRPCQQIVGLEEYASEVARVVDFLSTGGRSLVDIIAAARERSSEELDFEEAARQHKRFEKVQQVLKLRDELARAGARVSGVAVAPSVDAASVELWFLLDGYWQAPQRFAVRIESGSSVSLDSRLRELVASLPAPTGTLVEKEDHLALLTRWYYASWREGEWLAFDSFAEVPYRRLVRAISRVVAK
jgi:excinuclease UvrABC nuclease subunit